MIKIDVMVDQSRALTMQVIDKKKLLMYISHLFKY